MSADKPASSMGTVAHFFALYGWMSWHFWSHIAAAVLWTLGGISFIGFVVERAKSERR